MFNDTKQMQRDVISDHVRPDLFTALTDISVEDGRK